MLLQSNDELRPGFARLGVQQIPSQEAGGEEELVQLLNVAIRRSDAIVLLGGMGRDGEFSTLATLCQGLNLEPKCDPSALETIQKYCRTNDIEPDEQMNYCAWLPEESLHLPNERGCEQGAIVSAGEQCIILLPGSTAQAGQIFEEQVLPYLYRFAGVEEEITITPPMPHRQRAQGQAPRRRKKHLTAAIAASFALVLVLPFALYSVSQQSMGQGESVIEAAVTIFSSLPPQKEDITGGTPLPQDGETDGQSQSQSSPQESSSSSASSSSSSAVSSSSSSSSTSAVSSSSSSKKPQSTNEEETSSNSSTKPQSSSKSSSVEETDTEEPITTDGGTLRVTVGGSVMEDSAFNIVCGVVQNEMGGTMHAEALKAQAVAAYSFIKYENRQGKAPSLGLKASVSASTKNAVSAVLGQGVYYGGSIAYTTYHAISAGYTNSSADVWGGSIPYLVPVDSSVDENAPGFSKTSSYSPSDIASRVQSSLGVSLEGDPSGWLEVLETNDGGYVTSMRVGSSTITGRKFREQVMSFSLRSASFDISYDGTSFSITTRGYGHGVGMSQRGADGYARQGWSYVDILEHYYRGTSVQ